MNNALLVFGIILGCYFVGLVVFSIIKYVSQKKKFKKELKDEESKQNQVNDN